VIAFSRVGGGHQTAARALAAALHHESDGAMAVRTVDVYVEQGRFPLTQFPAFYARIARSHPRLWAAVFHGTNRRRLRVEPGLMMRPFLLPGLRYVIEQERPELLVSVLPAVNGLLRRAIEKIADRPRFEVVLTDWAAIHRTWVAGGVDHYTAPTEAAREDLLRYGVRSSVVDVQGLPIGAEFSRPLPGLAERAALRRQLGLDPDRFTILVMVGAEGSPRALALLAELATRQLDAQLVVVCGRNNALRSAVLQLPAVQPLLVLGFVEHIAELMSVSDLLITKAGGVTLAEAFARALPIVVSDRLPGQETGNADYAERKGAVVSAERPSELVDLVSALRRSEKRRRQLAECALALAKPLAATDIAVAMLQRLDNA
jgi:UDP-N-acetylglucosamine:LPS N-acetylglucosamine transferase